MNNLEVRFDLESKRAKIKELELQTMEDGFWNDRKNSQEVFDELNHNKSLVKDYERINDKLASVNETYQLVKEETDEDIIGLLSMEYEELAALFADYEIKVLLSGKYDNSNAIVEIHPGAGGTESHDFASMLYRMLTRYVERKGFKMTVLDYLPGEEAGIKSVTFKVSGDLAYGYLKSEKGVHRLVRLSPFDSSGRRHTSFAAVSVTPEIKNVEIDIPDTDIDMETHRATGAGGQHINKTDSAVRLIHRPTGIVAACQSERSQHANRDQALTMLKSRVFELMQEEQAKKLDEITGVKSAIEWGSQIRSYVIHPYSMVKDTRTNYEEGNVDAVLDGKLEDFVYEFLNQNSNAQ